MKIGVQYFVPRDLRNKLAGKDAQDFWVKTIVAPRMKKYMPARDKQEPEKQLTIGANSHRNGIVTVKGPQMRYLFYGKVMAGKPRRPTKKDLIYTKTINSLAGPYWDRRLKQNEMNAMCEEMRNYLKNQIK